VSLAARKKQKTVPSPEEKEEKKNRKGEAQRRRRQEKQLYDEMVAKAGLLKHTKYSLSARFCFSPQTSLVKCFSLYVTQGFKEHSFSKKLK
jgi:hypothetical protein